MSAHHVVAVDAIRGVLHAVVDFPPEHRQVLGKPAGGRDTEYECTRRGSYGGRSMWRDKISFKTRRHQSTKKGQSVYLLRRMVKLNCTLHLAQNHRSDLDGLSAPRTTAMLFRGNSSMSG